MNAVEAAEAAYEQMYKQAVNTISVFLGMDGENPNIRTLNKATASFSGPQMFLMGKDYTENLFKKAKMQKCFDMLHAAATKYEQAMDQHGNHGAQSSAATINSNQDGNGNVVVGSNTSVTGNLMIGCGDKNTQNAGNNSGEIVFGNKSQNTNIYVTDATTAQLLGVGLSNFNNSEIAADVKNDEKKLQEMLGRGLVSVLLGGLNPIAVALARRLEELQALELIRNSKLKSDDIIGMFLQQSPNEHGVTALMVAASYGYYQAIPKLLEMGEDPDMEDKNGMTALMMAMMPQEDDEDWEVEDKMRVINLLRGDRTNAELNEMRRVLWFPKVPPRLL